MHLPIYLDYAATTPVDPRIAEEMMKCLTIEGTFGNPASNTHVYGWNAAKKVEEARKHVAELIHAEPREIIWTSGATEANNLAILGAARFYKSKGKHLITALTEHKAVLDAFKYLESEGFSVTYLKPEKTGLISLENLEKAIRPDTILISIMHVNNELGVIQDIELIAELTRSKNIIFHVDAAQSAGKIPIDLSVLKIDLLSLSAHKIYGPKGVGALFVRQHPRVRLIPIIYGGGHERGLRSGTLPTHQIAGMGEAFKIAKIEMAEESERIKNLRNKLWEGIQTIEATQLNTHLAQAAPHILNVSFNYVEGESLMMAMKDIAVSSGSACTSATLETSHVLKALGLPDEISHSSLRFSLGRYTTEEEINYTINLIHQKINKLRELSPLWDMYKQGIDIINYKWGEH